MKFSDLEGKWVGFCGVDNNAFCLLTEDGERLAFEAVEDESEGYRSMLDEVKGVPLDGLIFFSSPIAFVVIEAEKGPTGRYGTFDGWRLVDAAGHQWLLIGTDYSDDYYPCFTFDYDPPREVCTVHEDGRGNTELARACAATPTGTKGEDGGPQPSVWIIKFAERYMRPSGVLTDRLALAERFSNRTEAARRMGMVRNAWSRDAWRVVKLTPRSAPVGCPPVTPVSKD